MVEAETVHASCIALGEAGILIRGPSGSGKSSFARELLQKVQASGRFARLVSDDRTRIRACHGRILAQPVEPIAGLVEVRGVGLLPAVHEPVAVVRLVVDLSLEEPPRLPEPEDGAVPLCGVMVPRLRGRSGAILADLVVARASGFHDTFMTE